MLGWWRAKANQPLIRHISWHDGESSPLHPIQSGRGRSVQAKASRSAERPVKSYHGDTIIRHTDEEMRERMREICRNTLRASRFQVRDADQKSTTARSQCVQPALRFSECLSAKCTASIDGPGEPHDNSHYLPTPQRTIAPDFFET